MQAQQQQQQQQAVAGLALLMLLLLLLLLSSAGSAQAEGAVQLQTCVDGFVVHRDKIIRTEDSLKLGAAYLAEYEVNSKIECIKWCCETARCDVFVYEERKLGGCYLFHCGPPHDFKCKFTNHVNYSSAVLTNYNLQPADAIDELKSLRTSHAAPAAPGPVAVAASPSTTTGTTSASTSASPPSSSESAKPSPRSSCSRNQFECRSSDDCIAIYNVCDGIPQCADGSDEALELGCPRERTTALPPPPPPPPPQPRHQPQAQLQHQQQSQIAGRPDLIGYQQMMQHQAMRLYPPVGPPAPNQENLNNGWPINYQAAASQAQPAANRVPQQQQQQQQQQQLQAVNYDHWQQTAADAAPPDRWPPLALDEQKLAIAVNRASHANAFQPPNSPDSYPAPPQQLPHIFNHKPAGVRLDELEAANGLYGGQDPNRGYAPYYPAVIRHPEASPWREAANDNLPPPPREMPQQPNSIARLPQRATAGPPRENVPYQEPDKLAMTSSTPPPCDSSENRQSDAHEQRLQPHPKSSHAAAEGSAEHKAHELELKTVAQAHLQERKSIAIVDHLGRGGQQHAGPRIEELEMTRPKGAVISLALGLSVTAIMAVLIACRLRVVKRRGRGRSHDSYAHDTDYLVNGMYL